MAHFFNFHFNTLFEYIIQKEYCQQSGGSMYN